MKIDGKFRLYFLFLLIFSLTGSSLIADIDGNDICSTAESITLADTAEGTVAPTTDPEDWYLFTAPSAVSITIDYSSSERTELWMTVNGCAANKVMNNDYTYNNYASPINMNAGDTLSIRIVNRSNSTPPAYSFSIAEVYNMSSSNFRPYTKIIINGDTNTNINGDMTIIGNSQLGCREYRSGWWWYSCSGEAPSGVPNNDIRTQYLDIDSDGTTFNSTSADITTATVPADAEVIWAGLYWQGRMRQSSSDTVKNSGQTVKFKKPGGDYVDVVASTYNWINTDSGSGDSDRFDFQGFRDITNLIDKTNPHGTYTVANIQADEGTDDIRNRYGAWSIVFVYKSVSKPLKNISVYDGYLSLYSSADTTNGTYSDIEVTLSGFLTPTSGNVDSTFFVFAGEGDQAFEDGIWMDDQTPTKTPVTSINNTDGNQINSTETADGVNVTTRNPSYTNTIGIDIDTFNVGTTGLGIIGNTQTSTKIYLESHGDRYFPAVFAFSTQLYEPNLCYEEIVYDANGNTLQDGAEVAYGDPVNVQVRLLNQDNETAQNVQIFRTFDTSFPYEQETTNADNNNNGLAMDFIHVTDANDTDIFKFSYTGISGTELTGPFAINLGTDANSTDGGDFAPGQQAWFEYNASVNTDQNYTITYDIAYLNPITGDTYNGQLVNKCSDFNTSFWGRSPVVTSNINFGIADTWRDYDTDGTLGPITSASPYAREISTKVANRPFGLRGFSLDLSTGDPIPYEGTYSTSPTKTIPMSAFLSVTDDTCTLDTDDIGYVEIQHGQISAFAVQLNDRDNANLFIAEASKQDRIKAMVLDWRTILDNYDDLSCAVSSLTSSLCGVPGCFNSTGQIEDAFPDVNISVCIDGDGGGSAPCDQNAYNGNCGGKKDGYTISPEKYNNDMGCAACLADLAGQEVCSADDFAVRPNDFSFDSAAQVIQSDNPTVILSQAGPHPVSSVNKLRSGEEYNLTIDARDYNSNATTDYNQSTSYISAMTKHYLYSGGVLIQQDPVTTLNDVNITNTSAGGEFFNGHTTQFKIRYDEVGVVDLDLNDSNWAAVDVDDTGVNEPLPIGLASTEPGYVIFSATAAPLRLTVKPFDFNISAANLFDNNNGSGFTYLSNDMNMSARLPITVNARNKNAEITQNYSDATQGLYEQLTNFTLAVDNTAYPATLTLVPDLPTNADLPFINGTAVVGEDDENVTRFNFNRSTNIPVNPFRVDGADVNLSITDADDVYGDANGSFLGNATFVYGRTHMPRVRAMCSGGSCNGNMTFYFEFYGDKDANKTLITDLLTTPTRSLDSVNWYRNTVHQTNVGDGNVTASTTNIPTATISYTPNGGDVSSAVYNYSGSKGYPFKGSITVDTSTGNTQSWLIYDKYNAAATTVRGELEYYGPGEWSSTTGAESTVQDKTDTTRNKNTNRRIRW